MTTWPPRGEGYALISVLWFVTLLIAITGSYHTSARVEAKLLRGALYRTQATALADAGIWIAVRDHLTSTSTLPQRGSRLSRHFDFDEGSVDVRLAHASGWVNLNYATRDLLAAVLAQTSASPADQRSLLDAILDWRDLDHVRQPEGAEDEDYAQAGSLHGSKDAPFATVDELRLVRGMTDRVYREMAPVLTVYGSHTRVNIAAAPSVVRRALADPAYDPRFTQSSSQDIYSVLGTATAGGVTARVTAIVRHARGEKEPVQVLSWRTSTESLDTPPDDAGPHEDQR